MSFMDKLVQVGDVKTTVGVIGALYCDVGKGREDVSRPC